ncbi:hypothetical protein EYF80_056274 [Liparis tanakae]|uniref:Uncharacterized protein n=1 Tax=Liparis tanakae TaxID=230148 RepID=A0A4Z2EYW9_9TELE|nr:hypothetical protein EYF80_056274 [Liparis tanakae]
MSVRSAYDGVAINKRSAEECLFIRSISESECIRKLMKTLISPLRATAEGLGTRETGTGQSSLLSPDGSSNPVNSAYDQTAMTDGDCPLLEASPSPSGAEYAGQAKASRVAMTILQPASDSERHAGKASVPISQGEGRVSSPRAGPGLPQAAEATCSHSALLSPGCPASATPAN